MIGFLSTSAFSLLRTQELDFFFFFNTRVLDVGCTHASKIQHRIMMKGMSD